MIDKIVSSADEAVADIKDGATILVGGFGPPGQPTALIDGLLRSGVKDLTIINNNAGAGGEAISDLFAAERVRKVICSFPKAIGSTVFDELYRAGKIELELVPQGTLAERIRAGGAGLGGFFTPTGFGTKLTEGRETRRIDGVDYVLEPPLRADFALIRGFKGDPIGNLIYRKTGRNFGPVMATAGGTVVAEVEEIVPTGSLDPEHIVTPGIYVDLIIEAPKSAERNI